MTQVDDSKNKFQRGMVYLFAIMAAVAVAPFVVIRYINGEFLNAAVDLAIVIAAMGSAIVTYLRGEATSDINFEN